MGEVYRARDTRLDRTVAIKLLPSELVNAPGRRVDRFRLEARAIARITHPGEETERELGWLVASFANALSSDGRTLIFSDGLSGRTPAGHATVFRRSTDGSPAVSLGEASGASALSPDERWVLAQLEGSLILLPAGAGSTVKLPKGEVAQFGRGAWLGDSKRIVFTGDPGDGKPRGYIQEIPDGLPRAFTPVGVSLAARAAVRDDNSILGRVGATWMFFPIHGGDAQPVPALKPGDIPVQWSYDGRSLYTVDNVENVRSPAVDVFRVELTTGARVLWKTLTPSDPVGVEGTSIRSRLVITPDARSVLLLLHATAWRPIRRRWTEVTPSTQLVSRRHALRAVRCGCAVPRW